MTQSIPLTDIVLDALLDTAPGAMACTAADGRLGLASDQAERLLRRQP